MESNEIGLVIPVQSGGRLIGQGVYGCVFSPPLKCVQRGRTSGKRGRLGKLTEIIDIKNEIQAAEVFEHVRKEASKYLILPILNTLCKPLSMKLQKERDLIKCDALQKSGEEKMMHYELEHGGKTLADSLHALNPIHKLPFWDLTRKFLEIGTFMVFHGFVHNDMHSSNVMVNPSFHPRLIDFGRSYTAQGITKEVVDQLAAGSFMPELGQISPESSAQDGIELGQSMAKIYAEMRAKKPAILTVERVLGVSREIQMAEFKRFCEHSRAFQARDWVTLWKLYWPTVDAWAIGHNIMRILSRLVLSKQFTESEGWKRRGGIVKTVLRGLLRTSPVERLDCVEALAMYDPTNDLIHTPTGKAWLEAKQKQREKLNRQG